MANNFTPSVVAPLEEWDDTTDLIVWLVEQKTEYHLSIPELALEELPERYHGSNRFVTPGESICRFGRLGNWQ